MQRGKEKLGCVVEGAGGGQEGAWGWAVEPVSRKVKRMEFVLQAVGSH